MSESETDSETPRKTASRKKPVKAAGVAPEPEAFNPEDPQWQRDYFTRYRLVHAQIPRRFLSKTFQNFEQRDARRKALVQGASAYVQAFRMDGEGLPKGLLMQGPVGCGKSHLAVAILREVIAKGYTGLYYNTPDLLRDIRATFSDDSPLSEDVLLERVEETDLLVLDDLGAEKVSGFVLDRLYLIVNKRYEECKPMIVTTNLDEESLRNRFEDRIVSRLLEMSPRFGPFPEEDFRRRSLAK